MKSRVRCRGNDKFSQTNKYHCAFKSTTNNKKEKKEANKFLISVVYCFIKQKNKFSFEGIKNAEKKEKIKNFLFFRFFLQQN